MKNFKIYSINHKNYYDFSDIEKRINNKNRFSHLIKNDELSKYRIDYIIFNSDNLELSLIEFYQYYIKNYKYLYDIYFDIDIIKYMIENKKNLIYYDMNDNDYKSLKI